MERIGQNHGNIIRNFRFAIAVIWSDRRELPSVFGTGYDQQVCNMGVNLSFPKIPTSVWDM